MIPLRIRYFPNFINQIIVKNKILNNNSDNKCTFHLCFFSCESYFKYLYCSLHSLVNNITDFNYKVWVFNDNEQPITSKQMKIIQQLIPDIDIILWPKSMGWGAEQIERIWQAYGKAAIDANDEDIIARVDSDVFFFNDRIFKMVNNSNADLIGDGHFVGLKYTQGGCYFFKASAIKSINKMIEKETMSKLMEEIDIVVEDIAAHHFAKRLQLKIWITWFMMFPDELQNAGGLTKWQRWKFSCMHFVMKNKDAMLDAYFKDILKDKELQSFKKDIGL